MTCCPLSAHVNMHCSPTCLFGRPFLSRIFYLHESTDAPVRIDPKRPSQHLQSARDLLGCTWALQPEFRTEDFTGLPKKRWKLLMCSRRFGVWINSSSLHSGKICSPTCRVLSSCQVMIYGDQQTIWSLQQEVSTGWNWTYKRKRKKKKLRICFPSFSSKEASCCWGRRHSLCWTALLCEKTWKTADGRVNQYDEPDPDCHELKENNFKRLWDTRRNRGDEFELEKEAS